MYPISNLNLSQFKKDLLLLILLGICAYLLDIKTSNNLYKNCNNLSTQSFLLFHHFIYMYSLFGWLSNNIYILLINIIIIISMLLHWYTNNNICNWTEQIKQKCNSNQNLRTFIKLLFPNFKDKNRIKQKIYLSSILSISIIKVYFYIKSTN